MSHLNKIYHKGKYRSGEWAKHLRPYLKRKGNKQFRKDLKEVERESLLKSRKNKRSDKRRRIKVKLTVKLYGDAKMTYDKSYHSMRDLQNAIKRPRVIRYIILK